jgi:hypothetical protein
MSHSKASPRRLLTLATVDRLHCTDSHKFTDFAIVGLSYPIVNGLGRFLLFSAACDKIESRMARQDIRPGLAFMSRHIDSLSNQHLKYPNLTVVRRAPTVTVCLPTAGAVLE